MRCNLSTQLNPVAWSYRVHRILYLCLEERWWNAHLGFANERLLSTAQGRYHSCINSMYNKTDVFQVDQCFWHSLRYHCGFGQNVNPASVLEDLYSKSDRKHENIRGHSDYPLELYPRLLTNYYLPDCLMPPAPENLEPFNDHRSLLQCQCFILGCRGI